MSRPGFTLPASKNGDAVTFDKERFQRLWRGLKDGDYEISVEKRASIGVQQRRYYFAVIVPAFAEYWGLDSHDAHDLIKEHCNLKTIEVVNKDTGESEERSIVASTSGFTTDQWTEYIERCQRWGATEFGFVVPEPDKEWAFNKKDTAA